MDPFGTDTGRNNTHYTCPSTSIWPKWPQSTPKMTPKCSKVTQNVPKVTPSYPSSYIKSLKSIGKMSILWKATKIRSKQPSYTQSDVKVIPRLPHDPKINLEWPQNPSDSGFLGRPVVCKSIKKQRKYVYFLFMDPFGVDTRRNWTHYTCPSTSI